MRATSLLAVLALAAVAPLAHAADLTVVVRNAKGAPTPDVVVTVAPVRTTPTPARFDQPLVMTQRDQMFSPFVLVVPAGAEVRFPNADKVRHHVYSFSPAKTFELKLYGRDETRVVKFDKPGMVSLGCNIHDAMVAYIDVVDAPFAARTDKDGKAVLHGVPPGAATVQAWHPYLRAPGNTLTAATVVPAAGAAAHAFTVELRTPALRSNTY